MENQVSHTNPPKIFLRHNFDFDPVSGQKNLPCSPETTDQCMQVCLCICKEADRKAMSFELVRCPSICASKVIVNVPGNEQLSGSGSGPCGLEGDVFQYFLK